MNVVTSKTRILILDPGARPIEWAPWERATDLLATNSVVWSYGTALARVRGGWGKDGERTCIDLPPVLAKRGARSDRYYAKEPPLGSHNDVLFARDHYICMYCGERFPHKRLTREHIIPRSRGGLDVWSNVCAACVRCNQRKADRTPEEAGMKLLAVPYAPNHAEALILKERNVLADQMEFLVPHVPKGRRHVYQ